MVEGAMVGWAAGAASLATWTAGCPGCPVARMVQAAVLDERFWPQLFLMLLPLLVLSAIVAGIHRVGTRGRRRARRGEGGRR